MRDTDGVVEGGQEALLPLGTLALAVGGIALADLLSRLLLALGNWQPDLPLWRLAAVQTLGTQTTPVVISLSVLLAALLGGARGGRRSALVFAALLGVLAVGAFWLAAGIPATTAIFMDMPGVEEQDRLLRGSRQALIALPILGAWALLAAALLWRHARRQPEGPTEPAGAAGAPPAA